MVNRRTLRKTYQVDWFNKPQDFNNKHAGERAFVIGGGHSIQLLQEGGFDFKTLESEITIGINKAYKLLTPTYLIWGDYYFWKNWAREVTNIDCIKMAPENIVKGPARPDKLVALKRSTDPHQTIPNGFEKPFSFVNNTGVAGLRVAYALGCNPIYLVGMDIGPDPSGETHFHEDYKADTRRITPPQRYNQFRSTYEKAIEAMAEQGVSVYSCSETSPLNETIDYVPLPSLFS